MIRLATQLFSGVLFGAGVTVSGMVNPAKVLNFMDLVGNWDPTLIFVMGGGLLTALAGYQLAFRRGKPFLDGNFHLPTATKIDVSLVAGATLFGLGWGLSGFCPGPAVASLIFGHAQSFVFVLAMAVGILVSRLVPKAEG